MKRFLIGVLVMGLLLPAFAFAGGYGSPSPEELLQRIEQLTKELQTVKRQLEEVKAQQEDAMDTVDELSESVESVTVDGVGRFQVWGDYRFRVDTTKAEVPDYWNASTIMGAMGAFSAMSSSELQTALSGFMGFFSPEEMTQIGAVLAQWDGMDAASRQQAVQNMMAALSPEEQAQMLTAFGYGMTRGKDYRNDTLYTNRVRINVKVKPSENLVFKGRFEAYKAWGMSTQEVTSGGGMFPVNLMVNNFTYGIRPDDGRVYVDRAYVNWTNIGGLPIWFSVGRRPTTHTVPSQFREGLTKREASPTGNIDLPFDGSTIGYQYSAPFTGRIRFCYGRGFDSGFKGLGVDSQLDDTDFYGFVWDVIDDPDQNLLFVIQAFKAADVMDFPEGTMFNNGMGQWVDIKATSNLGDIYEIGTTVQHQYRGIDYFVSLGWSITDPRGRSKGLSDPLHPDNPPVFEGVSLLTNPDGKLNQHTGWSVYVGARIPFEQWRSKFGIEYNYGSKYWMPFLQAADDIYMDKRATRGHVGEVYWIWDLPETPLSKYARAFMRAGFQYYWFDYTGSGNWLGAPVDVDKLDEPFNAQPFAPIDHMTNGYLTFEVYF